MHADVYHLYICLGCGAPSMCSGSGVNYVHAVLFLWVISINMISMLLKQSIDIRAKQEPV